MYNIHKIHIEVAKVLTKILFLWMLLFIVVLMTVTCEDDIDMGA